MIEIKKKLFNAFGEDHAVLGNGFHILAVQLRDGNIITIKHAANKLDLNAGSHIAFEEFEFYPLLKSMSPTSNTDLMYESHAIGLSVLKSIFGLPAALDDNMITEEFKKEQLLNIELMDAHISECGELFSVMDKLSPKELEKLYERLLFWRKKGPRWTKVSKFKKKTSINAKVTKNNSHKKSFKPDTSPLPFLLSDNLAPELKRKDKARIHNIALKLKNEDPKLLPVDNFGSNVHQGYKSGPVLFYEDHRSISLSSEKTYGHYQYRFLTLARPEDILLVEKKRAFKYEKYCREVLKLPSPEILCLKTEEKNLSLARRCVENPDSINCIAEIAKLNGCMNIMPYISTGWTWVLARTIAEKANVPVFVMAPPPWLTQKTNDKLWFSERLIECLGPNSLPQTYYAFGPAALAIKVSRLAKTHSRIVVKIPSSAGSMGNIVIDTSRIKNMVLTDLMEYLHNLIYFQGSQNIYPLAVSVWDSEALTSPSLQVWIPLPQHGLPVVEGVFEQALDSVTHTFIGAKPAKLRTPLKKRLIYEASMICYLYQQLGYYGRCSLDAVVTNKGDKTEIHWVDCNARWGGVSIPMTIANRLIGNWQKYLRIIVQTKMNENAISKEDFLNSTTDFQFNSTTKKEGIVVMNPPQYDRASHHDYMIFAKSLSSGNSIFQNVNKISNQ